MHELKAGLNADKFVTFWILPKRFYHFRFANDLYALYNYPARSVSFDLPRRVLYNRPKANTLARFRKTMKTCESVKRNVELFL